MRRVVGLVASVLLHLIFLVALLIRPDLTGAGKPAMADLEENVIHISMMGDMIKPKETGDGESTNDDEDRCANGTKKYNGVGFIYSRETGIISDVPETTPAYKAGIREYDVLMNPTDGDLPPGPATIVIMRYGVSMSFVIETTKICYDTEKTAGPSE